MTNQEHIGRRLDAFRNELGLTQSELAKNVGVQQGFVNAIIHGKKGIGHTVIINIAKVYRQLNLRWLLLGEGDMFDPDRSNYSVHESGPLMLEEGIKIQYAQEGILEKMQRLLQEHDQRLKSLESK